MSSAVGREKWTSCPPSARGRCWPISSPRSRIPVARLTEVFRQAAESRIVVNAHRINKGQMPEVPKAGEESDFYFVEIDDPEEGVPKIIQMIKERMPRRFGLDPMKDIQVLCPMNRACSELVISTSSCKRCSIRTLHPRWSGLAGASRQEIG